MASSAPRPTLIGPDGGCRDLFGTADRAGAQGHQRRRRGRPGRDEVRRRGGARGRGGHADLGTGIGSAPFTRRLLVPNRLRPTSTSAGRTRKACSERARKSTPGLGAVGGPGRRVHEADLERAALAGVVHRGGGERESDKSCRCWPSCRPRWSRPPCTTTPARGGADRRLTAAPGGDSSARSARAGPKRGLHVGDRRAARSGTRWRRRPRPRWRRPRREVGQSPAPPLAMTGTVTAARTAWIISVSKPALRCVRVHGTSRISPTPRATARAAQATASIPVPRAATVRGHLEPAGQITGGRAPASTESTTHCDPNRRAASASNSGRATAAVFSDTLSAPARQQPVDVLVVRTPPPTVSGMNTCSAGFAAPPTGGLRLLLEAVMSRKTSSSAPWAS